MEAMMLVFGLIGLVIAIFWIALPFLVYGTNSRLDELLEEAKALRIAIQEMKAGGKQ